MLLYRLTMTVPAKLVSTVFDVMKDTGIEITATPQHTWRQPKKVRENGVRAIDIITKIVADSPGITVKGAAEALASQGYSPKSASPAISVACKAGAITRKNNQLYPMVRGK